MSTARTHRTTRTSWTAEALSSMPGDQAGMTLLELVIVLLVLVGLTGLGLAHLDSTSDRAACIATDATLSTVRDAAMGGATGAGFYNDMIPHRLPDNNGDGSYKLHYLFRRGANPTYRASTGTGWNGPYLAGGITAQVAFLDSTFTDAAYGTPAADGDIVVLDRYPRYTSPIVIQVPGSDGDGNDCEDLPGGDADPSVCARVVSAGPNGRLDTRRADARGTGRGDDRLLFLRIADPGENLPCG